MVLFTLCRLHPDVLKVLIQFFNYVKDEPRQREHCTLNPRDSVSEGVSVTSPVYFSSKILSLSKGRISEIKSCLIDCDSPQTETL